MSAVALASCNKSEDLYTPQEETDQQEERVLDFTINEQQTWKMESSQTVRVTNLPTDIEAKELRVYTANPFTDSTATILATTTEVGQMLTFAMPSYMTTLYAGCADDNGNLRVVSFQTADGIADFSNKGYSIVRKAARRALPVYADLEWTDTYNKIDLADKGWNDQYAEVSGATEVRHFDNRTEIYNSFAQLFGEDNNVDRVSHYYDEQRTFYYAKVGEGGGSITVTPMGTNGVTNSKMQLGYYYFEPGEEHSVKTVKKYLFSDIYSKTTKYTDDCNSYKLGYFDKEGNASYDFPEGTEVSFFLRVSELLGYQMDWYAEGEANIDRSMYLLEKGVPNNTNGAHDWWKEANHAFFCEVNGYKFVGLEDWIDNFNFKDMVLMLEGNVDDFPAVNNTKQIHHIYTFAFEDTEQGDYDLNDVVLQVCRGNQNRVPCIYARLVALGGNDPVKAYFKDSKTKEVTPLFGDKELHELFNTAGFVNTETLNYTNVKNNNDLQTVIIRTNAPATLVNENITSQDFYIINQKTGFEVHTPVALGLIGTEPYGLCIPTKWAWPKERTSIVTAYPTFANFSSKIVGGVQDCTDWYTKPTEGNSLTYDFQFNIN